MAAVAALAVWRCGGGDNLASEKPVSTVTVTPSASTIAPGETVQLQAATKDADGSTLTGRAITWSSSDNAVATASTTGVVTGIANGSATITASVDGQSGAAVITVTTTLTFAAVSAGFGHTCGLTGTGAAYCWGDNSDGQLGDGSRTPSLSPVLVSGGLSFSGLATGGVHTCALTGSGAPYCWGQNDYGQLGVGSTRSSSTPIAVRGSLRFRTLSSGGQHTCGLTNEESVYCWGLNDDGQPDAGPGDR
jgi:alpha-tubulin suppressor-like RCC1 family protein